MAFKALDLSNIPVGVKGRASATEPKIGISASGQIMPNSFVGKAWEGVDRVAVLFDDETRKFGLMGLKPDSKLPKGVTEASTLKLAKGKDGKGSGSIAASGLLKSILEYDYAASGNQAFDTVFNEKLGAFIITVPKGSLTPKPTVPRKPKEVSSKTVASAIVSKAIEPPADDELLLQ